jgi:hypothetical protein
LSEFILDLPGFKKIAKSIEQRAKRKSNLAHSEIPAISHELFAALSGFKIGYFGKNVNPYSAAEHEETAEVKEEKRMEEWNSG